MKQCPGCKRELKDHLLYCPFDGQMLVMKQDRLTGAVLDGKFRLDEKIGEGGMGKVYKATHIHLDYTVAVKVLHTHLSSDHIALERFRREAQTAVYVRHPNAVEVIDFGVTKETGMAYLVMEFLEGTELRDKIKRQRGIDYERLDDRALPGCVVAARPVRAEPEPAGHPRPVGLGPGRERDGAVPRQPAVGRLVRAVRRRRA